MNQLAPAGEDVTPFTLARVHPQLTRYLIHCDKVAVLLFYFGPVPGDEVNSKERQEAAAKQFEGDPMPL